MQDHLDDSFTRGSSESCISIFSLIIVRNMLDMLCHILIFPHVMFTKSDSINVVASAKINLFLEILGERDNGYHDLRSVVMPISLHDYLIIEKTDGVIESFLTDDSTVCCDALLELDSEDNLTNEAARALKKAVGYSGGATIAITKHIPIGGGLGGGSADAAAVLRGLNKLWGINLPEKELAEIGATVGCDVPALVYNRMVLMEGVGEKITPLNDSDGTKNDFDDDLGCVEVPAVWLVLLNPGFSVSTQDIFSRCNSSLTSNEISYKSMVCSLRGGRVEDVADSLFNGLEAVVFKKYPQIELMVDALSSAGSLGALLSGSGASVFGLALNEAHANQIARDVQVEMGRSVWSEVVRILPDSVMVAQGPLTALV